MMKIISDSKLRPCASCGLSHYMVFAVECQFDGIACVYLCAMCLMSPSIDKLFPLIHE